MPDPEPVIRVALDAHVIGRRGTGNESYVIGLLNGLAARDEIVLTAYLDRGATPPEGLPAGVGARRLRTRRPQLRIPLELPIRARADRADLLHVQYVAPPVAGLPVVTAVHDLSFEDGPGYFRPRTRWRLQASVRFSARRAAAVVTPSEFSRQRLLDRYQLDPDRVVVTPPCIPWPMDWPDSARAAERLEVLRLPPNFVLFVGNLNPRKNVERLVDAIGRARALGVELALVLAGQTASPRGDVERAVRRHAAEGWVHRLGYVHAALLPHLYVAARVVAYVSLYEGFGLPALEGMASGTPVVASNSSALPEVVGDAALQVDPYDVPAIAEALAAAATDQELRSRLAVAGRLRASGFTPARLAETTVAAYRRALER